MMIKRTAIGMAAAAIMLGGAVFGVGSASANGGGGALTTWEQHASYTGDCTHRPLHTVCIRYDDGYTWLIVESIVGWDSFVTRGGTVQVAKGTDAHYQHLLGTTYVRKVAP